MIVNKVFMYVRNVVGDHVQVDFTNISRPVDLPCELFDADLFGSLRTGCRLTARTNRTRMDKKLIVAGPFEMANPDVDDGLITASIFHEEGAHKDRRLFIVENYFCQTCKKHFCAECSPRAKHESTCAA